MKKIGLALAGGGGRGAYEIGVWKALRKSGLEKYISAVSGTSVGGLNAALFIQGDLEKAENIWGSISRRQILDRDRGGLSGIIDRNLDMKSFDNDSRNCYLACRLKKAPLKKTGHTEMFALPDGTKSPLCHANGKVTYFNMRGYSGEERKALLLATSAMRVIFPKVEIRGETYYDGGSADNVPIEPLYAVEKCRVIIAVHIDSREAHVDRKNFPEASIIEIFPKNGNGGFLTGMLDFNGAHAMRRIELGYGDTVGMFTKIKNIIDSRE